MIEQKVQHVLQTTLTFQIMREIRPKHQQQASKEEKVNQQLQ